MNSKKTVREWLVFIALILGVVFIDFTSKAYLMGYLKDSGGHQQITSFLNLVMVWNYGVSFGMLQIFGDWGSYLWSSLALALSSILILWGMRQSSKMLWISLGFIVGGALGNSIDRLYHGAVADFFDFYWKGYHWPAFNVADIAISFGACLIIIEAFLKKDLK